MANRIEGVTEKLLEQAMKEFLDKGYTGASLRTIAENAGTTTRRQGRAFCRSCFGMCRHAERYVHFIHEGL